MNVQLNWPRIATQSLLAAALAGCASGPTAVLLMLPPAVATPSASPVSHPLADATPTPLRVLNVSRVEIPEYLTTRRVRYRADAAALAEWPATVWGERIEIGVSREFASALHEKLPSWHLCESSCGDQSPSLSIQVQLGRVDYMRSERRLHASARMMLWTTERPSRLLSTTDRFYLVDSDADTARAQAQAMTELLRRVATDAASAIAATPRTF